jgi:hypothetical protein
MHIECNWRRYLLHSMGGFEFGSLWIVISFGCDNVFSK